MSVFIVTPFVPGRYSSFFASFSPGYGRGIMASEADTFRWRVHPFRERRGAAVLAVSAVLVAGGATFVAGGSLSWGLPAVVLLLVSLNRFFLPSRFEIDSEGAIARYPFKSYHVPWSQVKFAAGDDRIVLLQPEEMPLLLGRHGEEVWDRLQRYIPVGRWTRRIGPGRRWSAAPNDAQAARPAVTGVDDAHP